MSRNRPTAVTLTPARPRGETSPRCRHSATSGTKTEQVLICNQMVVHELTDSEVDRIFQALADATRRDILSRTLVREQSVSALAAHYEMSFAAVQKHVAVLERAALIAKERRGREQLVHPNAETLRRAARLLDRYEKIWHDRAERIGEILSEPEKGMEQ